MVGKVEWQILTVYCAGKSWCLVRRVKTAYMQNYLQNLEGWYYDNGMVLVRLLNLCSSQFSPARRLTSLFLYMSILYRLVLEVPPHITKPYLRCDSSCPWKRPFVVWRLLARSICLVSPDLLIRNSGQMPSAQQTSHCVHVRDPKLSSSDKYTVLYMKSLLIFWYSFK